MIFDFQVHHIIPLEAYDHYADRIDRLLGKNSAQSYNNRIALLTDGENAKTIKIMQAKGKLQNLPIGSVAHRGNHSSYNTIVKGFVKGILEAHISER